MGTGAKNGPRLKIERAKHHINDLNTSMVDFLSKNPFEVFVGQEPKSTKRFLLIKTNQLIPDKFALIMGDAIHDLRTALDLFIFGLIGDRADRPDAVQFPFGKNLRTFKSVFGTRQIQLAGENVQRTIHDLKPYCRGNDLLYGLHLLDIADKHKLIIPAGSSAGMVARDIRRFDPAITNVGGLGTVAYISNESDRIILEYSIGTANRDTRRTIRSFEQKTGFQPPFMLCFPEKPFLGHLLVPTLREITLEVERAIGLLEAAVEADAGSVDAAAKGGRDDPQSSA